MSVSRQGKQILTLAHLSRVRQIVRPRPIVTLHIRAHHLPCIKRMLGIIHVGKRITFDTQA
jgi:hypothetical protein